MTKPATRKVAIYRHPIVVRATHWTGVAAVFFLLASGLQIFDAHPGLYLGQKSTFASPIFSISADQAPSGALVGHVNFGQAIHLNTTGVLGVSKGADGQPEARAFPHWLTLPGYTDLATGRRWHFFFAWIFAANLALMLVYGLLSGRYPRNFALSRADLADIGPSIWHHLQLKFPEGDAARRYNVLQKLAYLAVIALFLPLMILTGLSMSPAMDAAFPWLPQLFGGRQGARTLHFVTASAIAGFVAIHLAMVLVSGLFNNLRAILTGVYVIRLPTEETLGEPDAAP